MKITVKKMNNQKYDVSCSPGDTLLDLNHKVMLKTGIPTEQQRLIFDARTLSGVKLLGEEGIYDGCTLYLLTKVLSGGGCFGVGFNFASLESGSKRGFSANAPQYRVIGHGFNLEGRCTNKKCDASRNLAWSRLGFSCTPKDVTSTFQTAGFNIGTEIYRTPCPLCKEFFEPESIVSCGFFQCQYTYEGYQQGSRSASKGSGKASCEDGFEYHNGIMDSKSWSSLIIVVEPLSQTADSPAEEAALPATKRI